jgi:hypothetical protein
VILRNARCNNEDFGFLCVCGCPDDVYIFVLLKDVTEMDNMSLVLCCFINQSIFTLHYFVIRFKPVSYSLHSDRNIETEPLSYSSDCSRVGMNVF